MTYFPLQYKLITPLYIIVFPSYNFIFLNIIIYLRQNFFPLFNIIYKKINNKYFTYKNLFLYTFKTKINIYIVYV